MVSFTRGQQSWNESIRMIMVVEFVKAIDKEALAMMDWEEIYSAYHSMLDYLGLEKEYWLI